MFGAINLLLTFTTKIYLIDRRLFHFEELILMAILATDNFASKLPNSCLKYFSKCKHFNCQVS